MGRRMEITPWGGWSETHREEVGGSSMGRSMEMSS